MLPALPLRFFSGQGTNEGYTFRDQVTLLSAVVSVARPNRNEKMNDSPVDAHPEPEGGEIAVE